jgi:hypothetical protein
MSDNSGKIGIGVAAAAVIGGKLLFLDSVENPGLRKEALKAALGSGVHAESHFDPAIIASRARIADQTSDFLKDTVPIGPRDNQLLGVRLSEAAIRGGLHQRDATVKTVSSYFDAARPKVIEELSAIYPPISAAEAQDVINREIASSISDTTKNANSNVTFEYLTGKLTIDHSNKIYGIAVKPGEVNICKISSAMALGIAACNGKIVDEFKPCVEKVFNRTEEVVAKEISE